MSEPHISDTPVPELPCRTITEASERIHRRELSPVELTRVCLERIEKLDPAINAYITVTAESAQEQAAQREGELARGEWRGPLHGIPIALKDNIDTAGVLTTAASGVFADRVPTEDAPVVQRLKEAGAILLGKLNMHEFAFGTTSLISHYGPVRNPWNAGHIAGGSSGGSAAAVAAGLCLGALGTDTGGSIRLPAACCGIAGLKPTTGRVSTRGVIPLSWTLDHVGPMCRTVADTTLMLAAIAGYDPLDPASRDIAGDFSLALGSGVAGARIGVLSRFSPSAIVGRAVEEALGLLLSLGATLQDADISVPWDAYGDILFPEAIAYHSDFFVASRALYAPVTRERLAGGVHVTATEYIAARREVELARRAVADIFSQVDVLVAPTTPVPALSVAECVNPTALPLEFTCPFNLLGLPAISIPCGFTPDGLPIGLQIVGPYGGESAVIKVAYAYEQATDWHLRQPPLDAEKA